MPFLSQIRSLLQPLWRKTMIMANIISPLKPPKNPVIAIIGSTGTGKSKLAVELATRYNGEIVNADAIQLYKGLPIVTNKIPENERAGIPHHLLDMVELHEQTWTVHQFVREADRVIQDIQQRGKLPIVVGGTMYYVLGLLFRDTALVSAEDRTSSEDDDTTDEGPGAESDRASAAITSDLSILSNDTPTSTILAKLAEVDPIMAARWHPADRRKIVRSLQIYLQTGRKASDIYAEQAAAKASDAEACQSVAGSAVEYEPLLLWPDAKDRILKQRLDDRVEDMMQDGLLDEVKAMRRYACAASQTTKIDQCKGVWQAIGYKELCPYIDLAASGADGENREELQRLLAKGLEMMRGGTRRYAKRQNRYIRIRFAKELQTRGLLHRLFLLDTSDLSRWSENVSRTSEDIVECFLSGARLPLNTSLPNTVVPNRDEGETGSNHVRHCDTCNKTMVTELQWTRHIASKSHRKVRDSIRKREKAQAYLSQRSAAPVSAQ